MPHFMLQSRFVAALLLLLVPFMAITTSNSSGRSVAPARFVVDAASSGADFLSTREEILASRERRMKQIETLLEDSQQRLNDHKSGIRMLNEKELNDLQKKIDIYTRKLESMMAPLDEREIQRIIQREQIRNDRIKERRNTHREL